MRSKKFLLEIFLLILISIYAFLINYHFGFLGFNYIDSFQHIAGGEKVLDNQIPFKDYWVADSGPMMDLMQGFLFKILNVSWGSLVINASITNAIFAVTIFWFCKIIEIGLIPKIILPIIGATIMYPTSGTPLIDYHALIFSFLGLTCFLYCLKSRKFKLLIFIPAIFFISFFFKQVPTSYFIILIIILSIYYYYFKNIKNIFYLNLLGAILILFFFIVLVNSLNIDLINIYEQYFVMPISQFSYRSENFDTSFFSTSQKIRYVIFLVIPSLLLLFLDYKKKKLNENTTLYILLFSFFIIAALHESYTFNQAVTLGILPFVSAVIIKLIKKNNYLFLIFCFLNLIILIKLITYDIMYSFLLLAFIIILFLKSKKLHSLQGLILLLIFYSTLTTFYYFEKLTINRHWQDIYNNDWKIYSKDASLLDKKLTGLKWISNNPNTEKEFEDFLDNLTYLKSIKDEGNYILITHYQIYNMILNNKNFSPVKYWWKNGSYPVNNLELKKKFDSFFIDKINHNNIKKLIILDDSSIYDSFNINNFNWIKNCSYLDKEKSSKQKTIIIINSKCKI